MSKKLVSLLAEVLSLPVEQIVPELKKEEVGSWDSLKQMDLVMSIEQKFGISLEITDIIRMDSVKNIIDILQEKGVEIGG